MKGHVQISREQFRWLLILLALLPLIPTAMLVRTAMDSYRWEREQAMEHEKGVYRDVVARTVNKVAQRLRGSEASVAIEEKGAISEEIRRALVDVVRENATITVLPGNAVTDAEAPAPRGVVYDVPEGMLKGWRVQVEDLSMSGVEEMERDQKAESFRRTFWVVAGVCLAAGLVWMAVNRRMETEDLRSDILSTVAHELRTPVASSRLLLETLREEGEKRPELWEAYLPLLARENERLAQTIEQFLTLGRMEGKRAAYVTRSVDLAEVIRQAVAKHQSLALECNGKVDLSGVEPGVFAAGHGEALVAVVGNLIENGLKYGGKPPELSLATRRMGTTVEIVVADRGPGIPAADRKRVFERFFQSDRRLSRVGGGVGLGLAICQRIAEALQGQVRLEERPGGGTVAVLSLPAAEAPETVVASGPEVENPNLDNACLPSSS